MVVINGSWVEKCQAHEFCVHMDLDLNAAAATD